VVVSSGGTGGTGRRNNQIRGAETGLRMSKATLGGARSLYCLAAGETHDPETGLDTWKQRRKPPRVQLWQLGHQWLLRPARRSRLTEVPQRRQGKPLRLYTQAWPP